MKKDIKTMKKKSSEAIEPPCFGEDFPIDEYTKAFVMWEFGNGNAVQDAVDFAHSTVVDYIYNGHVTIAEAMKSPMVTSLYNTFEWWTNRFACGDKKAQQFLDQLQEDLVKGVCQHIIDINRKDDEIRLAYLDLDIDDALNMYLPQLEKTSVIFKEE